MTLSEGSPGHVITVGVARLFTAGSSEREILKLTASGRGLGGRARPRRWLDGRGAPSSSGTRQRAPDRGVATVLLPLVVGLTWAHKLDIARDDLQPKLGQCRGYG